MAIAVALDAGQNIRLDHRGAKLWRMTNMMGSKPWYLSMGVVGALITIILAALQIDLDQEAKNLLTENVTSLLTAVFGLIALIGRIRAKTSVRLK